MLRRCVSQLKITTALLAYRAAMIGVPAPTIAAITGQEVPDPFARLVPYAKAMVALQLHALRALRARST
jgi:hypothetical protein